MTNRNGTVARSLLLYEFTNQSRERLGLFAFPGQRLSGLMICMKRSITSPLSRPALLLPMRLQDLEAFDSVPFLLWEKDEHGVHPFGNKAICDLAGESVVGKRDNDLIWSNDADALQAHDRKVLESGKTEYLHEYVQKSRHGQATLNVCKWAGELDGKKCCFGISFVIDDK